MGVDCRILLPAAARLCDVADVMAALAGIPMRNAELSNQGGYYAKAEYRTETMPTMPECTMIFVDAVPGSKLADGEKQHYVLYHFEGSRKGEHLLMPPSTPFWIAIGRGLVDFFGGTLDYNDCDDSDVDYQKPEMPDIHAEDNKEWYQLQDRKLAVKPITKADLKWAATHAA